MHNDIGMNEMRRNNDARRTNACIKKINIKQFLRRNFLKNLLELI